MKFGGKQHRMAMRLNHHKIMMKTHGYEWTERADGHLIFHDFSNDGSTDRDVDITHMSVRNFREFIGY